MSKNYHYYLSAETSSSERFVSFRAIFSKECEITRCFIVATSLKQALSVLYHKLSPVWTSDYLDNHLLRVEFFDSFI